MLERAILQLRDKCRFLVLVVLVSVLAACPQAPTEPQPLTAGEMDQIAAATQDIVKALLAGDASKTAAGFGGDAILLPDDAEMVQGGAEIEKYYENVFAQGQLSELTLTEVEVSGQGNLAYEVGTFTRTWTPPGSEASVSDAGKYVNVYKRQADGSWKCAASIWNLDQPPPPATTSE